METSKNSVRVYTILWRWAFLWTQLPPLL